MTAFAAKGIVAAPVLPMHPDFSIDWDGLRTYLAWIAKQRPTAIAMNMDASEGPALSRDEMLEVVRVSRKAIGDPCDAPGAARRGLLRAGARVGKRPRQRRPATYAPRR